MSVLNQSGEEQQECPLCMEPLEVDDLNFYPCTCGYQICRFCWHRIRTDENGLCPACRKAYSENPADFTPLSQEQVSKLKAEKRQRDLQRKAKLSESRKHLASVRVVQRNLVFVVGLPVRLADAEVLRRHEYFGKFGKIHKVVINQSTAYAGTQGPSASAYVTYVKGDDALRAIQSVNNITLDGRQIKSSLGTTKYCSHFMKNQACPKPDCMYLHDFGDSEASFTKEQMHAGKHQEYEKRLHDALLARIHSVDNNKATASKASNNKEANRANGSTTPTKDNWPQLNNNVTQSQQIVATTTTTTVVVVDSNTTTTSSSSTMKKEKEKTKKNGKTKTDKKKLLVDDADKLKEDSMSDLSQSPPTSSSTSSSPPVAPICQHHKLPPPMDDNSSFFSSNSFKKIQPSSQELLDDDPTEHQVLSDAMPNISSSEDWAAAFGFPRHAPTSEQQQQDELKSRFSVPPPMLHHQHNGFAGKNMDLAYNGFLHDVFSKSAQQQPTQQQQQQQSNGLDHNLSKFFMDFHKNNKEVPPSSAFNGNSLFQAERIMLLQQKQLEEQSINFSMQPPNFYQQQQQQAQQNGFMNGGTDSFGLFPSSSSTTTNSTSANSSTTTSKQHRHRNIEDELDFDPIQETQKAFAELMAAEQQQKHRNGGYMPPPPPPGFVQPQQQHNHMNSFGSKILPFLNMSSTQQPQQQQNWPSFSHQLPQQQQQPQQQKNISNACNDWKVLDPAILSSSRHYPLANHFNGMPAGMQQQQQQQPQQQQIRQNYDLLGGSGGGNSPFNFSQPSNLGGGAGFLHHHHLNNHNNQPQSPQNWFNGEIGSTISTPPGFRNQQANNKQQQEC